MSAAVLNEVDARHGGPFDEARQIASLVLMPRLLESLGFDVNERTRRCACILHGGSNRSAFAWTEDGLWTCFNCGAGGDRIALVLAARKCTFTQAVRFLADIAGVEYHEKAFSSEELAHRRNLLEEAGDEAWGWLRLIISARGDCNRRLIRCERLQQYVGELLPTSCDEQERARLWTILSELAPISTRLLAEKQFLDNSDTATLLRYLTATPDQKRAMVIGEDSE